jgi:hypothetical protein
VKNNIVGYIDEISNANLGIGDSIANAIGQDNME